MDEHYPAFRLMQFSTDELPPEERFDLWRDVLTRKLFSAAIDTLSDSPFRAKASLRAHGGVRIAGGVTAPCVNHHTRELAANDNDDVVLLVNVEGPCTVMQRGETLDLAEGDATVMNCSEPSTVVRHTLGKVFCVRAPSADMGVLAPDLGLAVGKRIAQRADGLRLLANYVGGLEDIDQEELSPAAGRLVSQHLLDLTALVIGHASNPDVFTASRGVGAARLRAIKTYVDENIADVSAEAAAQAHGISPRYLRRLFEQDGRTFSDFVADRRLTFVHAMLVSPRFRDRSIAEIAFEAGFNDLSHFNRGFRSRYNATPREVRAEALEERSGR